MPSAMAHRPDLNCCEKFLFCLRCCTRVLFEWGLAHIFVMRQYDVLLSFSHRWRSIFLRNAQICFENCFRTLKHTRMSASITDRKCNGRALLRHDQYSFGTRNNQDRCCRHSLVFSASNLWSPCEFRLKNDCDVNHDCLASTCEPKSHCCLWNAPRFVLILMDARVRTAIMCTHAKYVTVKNRKLSRFVTVD